MRVRVNGVEIPVVVEVTSQEAIPEGIRLPDTGVSLNTTYYGEYNEYNEQGLGNKRIGIGDIRVYDSALSTSSCQTVEQELMEKFGILI